MFIHNVLLENTSALLHFFSWNITYVAIVLLVIIQFIRSLSQATECIQHNSRHYISKQHPEEGCVNHIINESYNFEFLHWFANRSRNVEFHYTWEHAITHFIDTLLTRIHILHIIRESNGAEDKSECDSHEAYVKQGIDAVSDCLKDIGEHREITEYID